MGADAPGSDSDKLSRVGDAALEELLNRLEDPEAAKELPGTGLLNIANAYVKAREKQLERDINKPSGPAVDEIDVILGSPLPPERKRDLLQDALQRARERHDRILELLEGDLE